MISNYTNLNIKPIDLSTVDSITNIIGIHYEASFAILMNSIILGKLSYLIAIQLYIRWTFINYFSNLSKSG